jgi:hypothetical protein
MSDSWGILGNLTKEEIEYYMSLPHGKFKEHVSYISKKYRGKKKLTYTVKISEIRSDVTAGFVKIKAFDKTEALTAARTAPKTDVNWEKAPEQRDKYTYEYTIIQVD